MIEIREVFLREIEDLVEIHKEAFEDFFLTSLGDDFLKLYYTSVLRHPLGYLHGYFLNGKMKGFSAATFYSSGFHKSLVKKNLIHFLIVGVKLLFKNKGALLRLTKNLSKNKGTSGIQDKGKYAELLSIGVSSKCQGQGIGRILLEGLELEVKEKKIELLSLTTDYHNNQKTINFYHSMGYKVYYVFVSFPERKMYKMIKKINEI